jgi:hypothetical protein
MSIKMPDSLLRETIQQYVDCGQNTALAARLSGVPSETFRSRLMRALAKFNVDEFLPKAQWTYPKIIQVEMAGKKALIGGDAHIWPGPVSAMWQAFCTVAKKVRPECIVLNGDMLDGARVSRHAGVLGSRAPKVSAEIDACHAWLKMLPLAKHTHWTIGNHDMRVDNYLANNAPELEDYAGRLRDRFPNWQFSYSVMLNDVEVRHRFRGGIHATWNNALHAGLTIVTNHTHQLQVYAVRNRNGSHWGIETGMLGDPQSPAFEYTEGAPSRAIEGFVLLTFDEEGHLLPPEFCEMVRGRPVFRGQYLV